MTLFDRLIMAKMLPSSAITIAKHMNFLIITDILLELHKTTYRTFNNTFLQR